MRFLLVVIVITLFVMSQQNRISESGSLCLIYCLSISKQPIILSSLFCAIVELKWPRMAVQLVHVCIRGAWYSYCQWWFWLLLVFRASIILALFDIAPIEHILFFFFEILGPSARLNYFTLCFPITFFNLQVLVGDLA